MALLACGFHWKQRGTLYGFAEQWADFTIPVACHKPHYKCEISAMQMRILTKIRK